MHWHTLWFRHTVELLRSCHHLQQSNNNEIMSISPDTSSYQWKCLHAWFWLTWRGLAAGVGAAITRRLPRSDRSFSMRARTAGSTLNVSLLTAASFRDSVALTSAPFTWLSSIGLTSKMFLLVAAFDERTVRRRSEVSCALRSSTGAVGAWREAWA